MPEDILLPPPPKKRLEVVGSDELLPPPPKKKSGESTSINLKDGVQIQEPTSTSSRLSVPTFNDLVLGGKSPKQEQVQPTTDEQLNSFNEQTKRMLSGQGVGMQNKEAALSKPFEPLNKKEALAIQEEKGIEHKQNAEKGIGITAEKRLTAQGIKPTEENLTTEKAKVLEDIKNGKLSYNPSTKTYQRDAGVIEGFLKGFNKNLINASYGITKGINAALGNDNTEKENQQKAELESIERDPYGSMLHSLNIFKTDEDKRLLEVAKKTSGNELNYEGLVPSLGSLAGDISYFNPTNFVAGTLPKIGTALAMGYTKNYGEKSNEIYSQLKNEGYSDEDAAKKASIDATAQAIPNTIFEAALFGGVIPHAKPAEDFLSSIGQMAKRTVAFSAANAPVQGLDEAIKGMQGYDTKGWEGRVKSAVLNGMGMVALMEGFPILAKLPKYTQSAFKEFANQPAIRPLVDKALENLPYGEKVKQQLDAYKATTEPLRGVVPDEKMAAIGGLQEKRNNIQAIIDGVATSMKQLETDKKSAPALEKNFDGKILLYQKFIDDKQSEIDAIDKKIKTFDKSDNPIEEEVDDATGQTAKQENETTRQPIATKKPIEEITTVPIETEVSGSTKKQPGEIIQPTEEVKVEEPNVEQLRASEQAELDTKIPNAEQYRVDGKVDRSKLTNDADRKAFDEVYNKYDKLITPLLEKEGSVGVVGDVESKKKSFTEAGEQSKKDQSPKALGNFIIDNAQVGDRIKINENEYYEVVSKRTNKKGHTETELQHFVKNEETGEFENNPTAVKLFTDKYRGTDQEKLGYRDASDLFESTYTNSKGERITEQSTFEPKAVEKSLKETPKAETTSKPIVEEQKAEINYDEKIKEAENKYAAAKKEFDKASKKISDTQGKQTGMFDATQKGILPIGDAEAKSILDPLRKKAKEAKAEWDDLLAKKKVQDEKQQELFNQEPQEKHSTTASINKQTYAKVREIDTPTDARGLALEYFANGGKIHPAELLNEVVGKASDAEQRTGSNADARRLAAEKEGSNIFDPNGDTIKNVADGIFRKANKHLDSDLGFDEQDVRNAIIEVVGNHQTRASVAEEYINSYHPEEVQKQYEKQLAEQMAAYESQHKNEYKDLSNEELNQVFNDIQDEDAYSNEIDYNLNHITNEQETTNGEIPTINNATEKTVLNENGSIKETETKGNELAKNESEVNNIFTESDNPTREGKSKKALIDAKKEVFEKYQETYGENVKDKVKDINTNFDDYIKSLKEIGEIIKIEC